MGTDFGVTGDAKTLPHFWSNYDTVVFTVFLSIITGQQDVDEVCRAVKRYVMEG
jgi:hypothetical protein